MLKVMFLTLMAAALINCSKGGNGPLVLPGSQCDATTDATCATTDQNINNNNNGNTKIPSAASCAMTASTTKTTFQVGDVVTFGSILLNAPAGVTDAGLKICLQGKKSFDGGANWIVDSDCNQVFSSPLQIGGTPFPNVSGIVAMYQRYIVISNRITGEVICDQSKTPAAPYAAIERFNITSSIVSNPGLSVMTLATGRTQYVLGNAPNFVIDGAPANSTVHLIVNHTGKQAVAQPSTEKDLGQTDGNGHFSGTLPATVPGEGGVYSDIVSVRDPSGNARTAAWNYRVLEMIMDRPVYAAGTNLAYYIYGGPANQTLFFSSTKDSVATLEKDQAYWDPSSGNTVLYQTDDSGQWSSLGGAAPTETDAHNWTKIVRVGLDEYNRATAAFQVVPQ